MSAPLPKQQINSAQENHRTTISINTKKADNYMMLSTTCSKVANSERQPLVILKKKPAKTYRAGA